MATVQPGALQQQLDQISEQIPRPVAARIDASLAEVATSETALGLAVGDRAPDFELPDAMGKTVSLGDRLVAGPVVLVFYRGEWCPYCNVHLRALQAALPEISARGASLIAISPQSPDHALSLREKADLSFDVLSDVDQAVLSSYKVRFTLPDDLQDLHINVFHNDLRQQTANRSWSLPVSATFVIDRDGIIRAAHVSADYRTRMEPAAVIAALDTLR